MENILDDLNDFDEESKRMLRGSRIIQFGELRKGIYGNDKDPFEDIKRNKTFDEISNEYVLSTPFEKKSTFYKPTTEDYDALSKGFYTGGINYELLAKDLKEKLGLINNFLFEPEKYLLEDKTVYSGSSSFNAPVFSSIKNNKPFVYKKNDTEIQATFDLAKLNTRKNLLSNSYNFGIYFDNYKVTYNINFIYKDGENKKFSDAQTDATETPYDFKLNDEYIAIKLYTGSAETFIEFLRIIKGNSQAEQMKNDIIRYYKHFFATAKSNPDIIDALYENIPDFVLEVLTDEMLWKDFVSLSEKAIDTSGTNENLSVINLLKGVKNGVWWSTQVNNSPNVVRKVLNKLKANYLENFIIALTKVGINAWKDSDYQNAITYSLEMKDTLKNGVVENRFVYWSGFLEKEKKFEVGFTIHSYENGNQAPSESGSETLGINEAFTPLRISDEKEDYFIPTIVANYFTEKQIENDRWTILENITAGLLPEFELIAFRNFSSLISKLRYSRYLKVLGENPAFQKILVELSSTRYMAKYLSLEEETAVRLYTSGYYSGLNRALRGEIAITEEYKVFKELLNNALKKLPKTSSSTFYRLEKMSPEMLSKEYAIGKTIEKKGFTSSTYDYMAAEEMMFDDSGLNVLIKITGKNGKNIEDASLLPAEREVLFRSNTKFEVESVKFDVSPVDNVSPITRVNIKER
ncbi:NAD:arginine ADP-ribosyltransferase [Chryseobacterium sp. 7]|uniref:ADP-ribosyltransferase domain-containing protein n=1 Tax=Chryseobacterium sp. 7 TaxID=2035214 RepID=UPI000EAF4973|nr:ADP-ribosyltransferase domain-containing protein [Chryseobacterium sp. 7]RLJ31964.1 NAD:arginine ADP-ribosyltransferase [Chryseobacterium sp. 7]